jgi:hypothetical protein
MFLTISIPVVFNCINHPLPILFVFESLRLLGTQNSFSIIKLSKSFIQILNFFSIYKFKFMSRYKIIFSVFIHSFLFNSLFDKVFFTRTARLKLISLEGSRKQLRKPAYSMLPSWLVSVHSNKNSISSL